MHERAFLDGFVYGKADLCARRDVSRPSIWFSKENSGLLYGTIAIVAGDLIVCDE